MIRDLEFPSLEYRTICKNLITILYHDDLIFSMLNYNICKPSSSKAILSQRNLDGIEDVLTKKVFKLPLPPKLAQRICNMIKPIVLEIMKWLECQKRISTSEIFLKLSIQNICWTAHGTVDTKRSAEALINNGKLNVSVKYKLACNYCLENSANIVWGNLSTKQKDIYLNKLSGSKNKIVKAMTYYISNEIDQLQRSRTNESVFEALLYAVEIGNKAATEFFVGKLPGEAKNIAIYRCLLKLQSQCIDALQLGDFGLATGYYSEIVLFLSRNANVGILERFNSIACASILILFLEFPVQQLFNEFAQYIQNLISHTTFCYTLSNIMLKLKFCYRDYSYTNLLKDFLNLKSEMFVAQRLPPFEFLYHFFEAQDEEGVSLILRGSSREMKQKIIFHVQGRELCEILVSQNKLDFLQFFIAACIEDENLETFQDLFRQVPKRYNFMFNPCGVFGDRIKNYSKLYNLVGDIIQRKGIKRCTDKSLPITKRTRSFIFTPKNVKLQEDFEWPVININDDF